MHPGIMMLMIWTLAVSAFVILPFQIETRTVTVYGFALLACFIAIFVMGTFLASPIMPQRLGTYSKMLDFAPADNLIRIVVAIALASLLIDYLNADFNSLEDAFLDRDARSVGVLRGFDTGGSIFFQLGFLTYPIGYIAIARETIFRERVNLFSLAFLGFFPLVLASLVMGGRGPILYGFVVLVAAFLSRRFIFSRHNQVKKQRSTMKRTTTAVIFAVSILFAMNYFVKVFLVRANVAGGVDAMLQISALNWGVSFNGPGSEILRTLIGEGNMYLIYVFLWYLVQGLVISNVVFTQFSGDPTLGIYGIDLASALARRFDPHFVSSRLLPLADINVYGFLPNAFGSLYVDFKYFAFFLTLAWGYVCGFVYRRIAVSQDARWLFTAPFISVGLIFSLINTPLGFGNGLATHLWLLLVALLIRPVNVAIPRPITDPTSSIR
jgi:hypothetical protein